MARTTPLDDLALAPRLAGEKSGVWLDRALRAAIQGGQLPAGARVPSSRRLGTQHGLARGTVMEVFAQLEVEGYLESRAGSGTRVARTLPDDFFRPAEKAHPRQARKAVVRRAALSKRGARLTHTPFPQASLVPRIRAFRAYQPSVEEFPVEVWARLSARKMRQVTRAMLAGTPELGWRPLQEAIAGHLGATRGVVCEPEQVMIVSGTQQALDLATRLLLAPGDAVWMEDPGYPGATALFRAAEARIVPVPVDDHGLQVAVGRRRARAARMAYVTPANQFPLGGALALERRLELLDWARESGAWVFEDDYDSEFRFVGRPLAALQGLDGSGQTLFSCSFNKMLFPTLRLGALVLPPGLVEPFRAARSLLDRHPPLLDQLVLCDFISEGHFGRHLRRMRQIYTERLAVLQEAIATLEGRLTLGRCDTGLQTTAWLTGGIDAQPFATRLAAEEVEVIPLAPYGLEWPAQHGLHLGFGAVNGREIQRGVEKMRQVLRSFPTKQRGRGFQDGPSPNPRNRVACGEPSP